MDTLGRAMDTLLLWVAVAVLAAACIVSGLALYAVLRLWRSAERGWRSAERGTSSDSPRPSRRPWKSGTTSDGPGS